MVRRDDAIRAAASRADARVRYNRGEKVRSDEASTEAFLRAVTQLEMNVVGEDIPIVNTIHFRPGTLTRSDETLARFFQYLRDYPRCHPSAEFIT